MLLTSPEATGMAIACVYVARSKIPSARRLESLSHPCSARPICGSNTRSARQIRFAAHARPPPGNDVRRQWLCVAGSATIAALASALLLMLAPLPAYGCRRRSLGVVARWRSRRTCPGIPSAHWSSSRSLLASADATADDTAACFGRCTDRRSSSPVASPTRRTLPTGSRREARATADPLELATALLVRSAVQSASRRRRRRQCLRATGERAHRGNRRPVSSRTGR